MQSYTISKKMERQIIAIDGGKLCQGHYLTQKHSLFAKFFIPVFRRCLTDFCFKAFTKVYEQSYPYLHTCVIHIVKDEDTA